MASNNISAAQISADYERRQREARQQAEQEAATNGEQSQPDDEDAGERVESVAQKKKRKRQQEQTLTKIKASKDHKRQKKRKGDDSEGEDEDVSWDMYTKKKPLPGQLENCELCEKRFTVTAYSKTGPGGGLLCAQCSKEQEAQKKKDQKPKKPVVGRDKRRQIQSNLLDGIVQIGAKTLQELCIKVIQAFLNLGHYAELMQEVANNIHNVDEFGDLPQALLNRLSQILSKRRVITSRTLDLFLRSDLETIDIYDCGSKALMFFSPRNGFADILQNSSTRTISDYFQWSPGYRTSTFAMQVNSRMRSWIIFLSAKFLYNHFSLRPPIWYRTRNGACSSKNADIGWSRSHYLGSIILWMMILS